MALTASATAWNGFLPRRAIVMARVSATSPVGPQAVEPAPLLTFVTDRPLDAETGPLLDRMLDALGLNRANVGLIQLEPGVPAPATQSKFLVALGEKACRMLLPASGPYSEIRGTLQKLGPTPVMPTHELEHLLRLPAAKREAWEDLKRVAQEAGLRIPKRS